MSALRSRSLLLGWLASLGLAASLAYPLSAGAAPAAASSDVSGRAVAQRLAGSPRVTDELRGRVGGAAADEEIPIGVTLDPAGLPGHGVSSERKREIARRQQRVLSVLPSRGARLGHRYVNLPGFSMRATPAVIEALAASPSVASVYVDGRVHETMNEGRPLMGADLATVAGLTGEGVSVAVLDSGIDTNHPDLMNDIVAERCWCDDGGNPNTGCCPFGGSIESGPGSAEDDRGHGTNVSGIITSSGAVAPLGVAPDAGIVALKVLDANGSGNFSDIAAALDWLIGNGPGLGVRVVNMSIGNNQQYGNGAVSPCTGSNTATAITDLDAAGIAVFVSSGNNGFDAGISYPACTPAAISVGGVYDQSFATVGWCGTTCSTILCTDSPATVDSFVCHTNSGTNLDVLAPDFQTTTSALGGGKLLQFGGTSAAAPYAAAVAALLVQDDPSRTPADIVNVMTTGAPLIQNPDNGLSFPRIDIHALFPECGDGMVEGAEDCDDGNTANGDCCSSTCSFEPLDSPCDDGDTCTASRCDGAGACSLSVPVVCDDSTYCNGLESCQQGVGCVAGTPPPVDDGVTCTFDYCDEDLDTVVHLQSDLFCDNGDFCDGAETCDPALDCQAGTPPPVDDGVTCTADSFDEATDTIVHTPDDVACDDGDFCDGAETCDPILDCQAGTPPPVDDGVTCTVDSCDEPTDTIVHTPDDLACDDSDPCTADACDEITGCSHALIQGCGATAVPVSGGPGPWLLAAALVASLWWALGRGRQSAMP